MKYLVLLNRRFPFRYGEAFLENEIDEVSGQFDRIIIYPSDAHIGDKQNRKISSQNVTVRTIEKSSLKLRKIKYLCSALRYISKSRQPKLLHKLLDGYFLAAAYDQMGKIRKDLGNFPIRSGDTVYFYSYWLYITAKVACLLKEYYEKKGIHTVVFSRAHRFDIYEEKRRFAYLPERINLLGHLDHVFACSDNGADYLKKHYPKFDRKISTSYLGTYDHGLGTVESRKKFHIISCSRMSSVKRVDLIIEALKLLKNENLSLVWTHLGGGELYDVITEKAKELDWMEVHLDGAVPNKEVYDHYRDCPEHLFVNVSSSEGLPVSIMEAISFGIPVIATDVGGTAEIVLDGVNGRLLDADFQPEELAGQIKYFVSLTDEEYRKYRMNARGTWEKYFQAPVNYKNFVHDIHTLYKEGKE